MKELGKLLKKWRTESKMNQRDAANRLHVDFTYVSKIENGVLSPSVELIEKMTFVYRRSREECDSAIMKKGELPTWIKPLILNNAYVFNNLKLYNRIWESERSSPPKEYA